MAAAVLTLIAVPTAAEAASAVETAIEALRRLGARVAPPSWLAPGIACDIPFDDLDADQADAAARTACAARAPAPAAHSPRASRRAWPRCALSRRSNAPGLI